MQHGLIAWLVIGILAGCLARIMANKKDSFGLIIDIIVGVAGSFNGAWLVHLIDWPPGYQMAGSTVVATFGAVILLIIVRLVEQR